MLVLRHLEPVGDADLARLREFAAAHKVQWYLQPKGPETAHPLPDEALRWATSLPSSVCATVFNPPSSPRSIRTSMPCWSAGRFVFFELRSDDRVGDLFCGLGNFTLPIAQRVAFTYGVEGSASLIAGRMKTPPGMDLLIVWILQSPICSKSPMTGLTHCHGSTSCSSTRLVTAPRRL